MKKTKSCWIKTAMIAAAVALGATAITLSPSHAQMNKYGKWGPDGELQITNGKNVQVKNGLIASTGSFTTSLTIESLTITGTGKFDALQTFDAGLTSETGPNTLGDTQFNGTIDGTGAVTFDSTLTVETGASSLQDVTASGTLGVTGATTLSDTLGVTGAATFDAGLTAETGQVSLGDTTLTKATIGTDDVLVRKSSSITTGELLALNAAGIELIAAPGVNKAIVVKRIAAKLDFATTAYGGVASGEDLLFSYTDASGQTIGVLETTGFIDQENDTYRIVFPISPADTTPQNYKVELNAAVFVSLLTGEIATGDSPLDLTIIYEIVDFDF